MEEVAKAIVSNFPGMNFYWNKSMPVGICRRWVDNERLKASGWRSRITFEEGIRLTVEWYRDNVESARN